MGGAEGNSNNDAPEDNLNKGTADPETPQGQQADHGDANERLKQIGDKGRLVGSLIGICHDAVLPFSFATIMLVGSNVRSLDPSLLSTELKTFFFIFFFLHGICFYIQVSGMK